MAALGEAVAKINHDMRNVLSSAVLVSDNLTNSKDPKVARAAPLVNGAIDRAITLCQQLLAYINTPDNVEINQMSMLALIDECRRQLELDVAEVGEPVSSTHVRSFLVQGAILLAQCLAVSTGQALQLRQLGP